MRFLRHTLNRLMSNLRDPLVPPFLSTCPTCYFLGGDGSIRSAKGSAALALDPAWQSASIESFTDVTDDVMISLLLDTERAQAHDYVSNDQAGLGNSLCTNNCQLMGTSPAESCSGRLINCFLGLSFRCQNIGANPFSPTGRMCILLKFKASEPKCTWHAS